MTKKEIKPYIINNLYFDNLVEVAKYYKINISKLKSRLKRGETIEEALDLKYSEDLSLKRKNMWLIKENKKICSKCNKILQIDDFYINSTSSKCIKCFKKIISENSIKRIYKIGIEEYLKILEKQNYKCAICNKKINKKTMCLDHHHNTGKIREALCNNCNAGLGFFEENIDRIENAIKYIKQFTFLENIKNNEDLFVDIEDAN